MSARRSADQGACRSPCGSADQRARRSAGRSAGRGSYRSSLLRLAVAALCLLGTAHAAIGDAPGTILAAVTDYAPAAGPAGEYRAAADARFRIDAIDGVAIRVSGEASLNDANVRFVADLIGAASGYGAGIAAPLAEYLRARVGELAGRGATVVGVEQYALSLTVTGSSPYHLAFALEPQQVDPALFPPARHSRGPADAAHVIREFSDFQCPYCQRFATEVLPGLQRELLAGQDVRFEYHHFPLKSIHPNAAAAAEAAECAAAAGGPEAFWTMHDRLFAQQAQWQALPDPVDAFVRLAADAGLASADLAPCIREGRFSDEVEAAFQAAAAGLRLTGTPTVFVDGLRLGDYTDVRAYARLMRLSAALRAEAAGQRPDATP